jgi:hypothetical protein
MRKVKDGKQKKKAGGVVLLEDLAPRKEVKGGAGKIVFGTGADPFLKEEEEEEEEEEEKKPKKK